MDEPRNYIISEVIKRKKDTEWYHLYVESKIGHESINETNRVTDIENRLIVAKGEGVGGRMEWEIGVSRGKLYI